MKKTFMAIMMMAAVATAFVGCKGGSEKSENDSTATEVAEADDPEADFEGVEEASGMDEELDAIDADELEGTVEDGTADIVEAGKEQLESAYESGKEAVEASVAKGKEMVKDAEQAVKNIPSEVKEKGKQALQDAINNL